jgi:hypothetical protein
MFPALKSEDFRLVGEGDVPPRLMPAGLIGPVAATA